MQSMVAKFEEVTIPGVQGSFTVKQIAPSKAYYLLIDIVALVAPAAFRSAGGGTKGFNLSKVDLSQVGGSLEHLFSRANREELKRITEVLFTGVQYVNGNKASPVDDKTIDFIFAGVPFGILALTKEALRINYHDFFAGLVATFQPLLDKAKAMKEAADQKEQSTSAGPSGDSSSPE
jgi:hypothetical protein